MTSALPQFLCDLLRSPPRAGEGVHVWLFRVSRQLHAHLPAGEIVRLLEARVATCERVVSRQEIEDAVANSLRCAWRPRGLPAGQTAPPAAKWPGVNQEQREAIIRDGPGLADLWELSPYRIEDDRVHTEELIDALFPRNPLLCCAKSDREFDTRPREDWRGDLSGLQLIVPSPMSAITGTTKEGHPSQHCLDNTGPRRFLIVEFDTGTFDDHAALLLHLAGFAPMALAVHSGGKSLHGWFYAAGQAEAKISSFFRYAITIGADPAMWTRCQFARMPDGTRDNGKRQAVFYFNPAAIKT